MQEKRRRAEETQPLKRNQELPSRVKQTEKLLARTNSPFQRCCFLEDGHAE
jgi:hypothetical protein